MHLQLILHVSLACFLPLGAQSSNRCSAWQSRDPTSSRQRQRPGQRNLHPLAKKSDGARFHFSYHIVRRHQVRSDTPCPSSLTTASSSVLRILRIRCQLRRTFQPRILHTRQGPNSCFKLQKSALASYFYVNRKAIPLLRVRGLLTSRPPPCSSLMFVHMVYLDLRAHRWPLHTTSNVSLCV